MINGGRIHARTGPTPAPTGKITIYGWSIYGWSINYAALLCPERERKKYVGTLLVAMLYEG
jgi:hypothetical protein